MINKKVICGLLVLLGNSTMFPKMPLCISLGAACGSAMMLRDLNLRTEAYPFDWVVSHGDVVYQALSTDF